MVVSINAREEQVIISWLNLDEYGTKPEQPMSQHLSNFPNLTILLILFERFDVNRTNIVVTKELNLQNSVAKNCEIEKVTSRFNHPFEALWAYYMPLKKSTDTSIPIIPISLKVCKTFIFRHWPVSKYFTDKVPDIAYISYSNLNKLFFWARFEMKRWTYLKM